MKSWRYLLFSSLFVFALIFTIGCNSSSSDDADGSAVNITKTDTYYKVTIDYTNMDRYSIGKEYAQKALEILPRYEEYADSFLVDSSTTLHSHDPNLTYEVLLERAKEIYKQVDSDYTQEIEGFASQLSGGSTNVAGDGKISHDEYLLLNFNPDVSTLDSCSSIAVYGDRSSTGKTIIGRNTDWFPGNNAQIAYLNAIVYTKTGDKQVVSVNTLGFIGYGVALSSDGIFIANQYSDIGEAYSAVGKRSILLDIRKALETESTLDGVAEFLADSQKLYGYHHLMVLADKNSMKVLENDFERHRELRTESSELNPNITWGFTDAICAVNSFILKGNFDNHTKMPMDPEKPNLSNLGRWANYKTLLAEKGDTVDAEEIKSIISYCKPGAGGEDDGDIFWEYTIQSVVYSFGENKLQVWLHPPATPFNENPVYVEVPVPFEP